MRQRRVRLAHLLVDLRSRERPSVRSLLALRPSLRQPRMPPIEQLFGGARPHLLFQDHIDLASAPAQPYLSRKCAETKRGNRERNRKRSGRSGVHAPHPAPDRIAGQPVNLENLSERKCVIDLMILPESGHRIIDHGHVASRAKHESQRHQGCACGGTVRQSGDITPRGDWQPFLRPVCQCSLLADPMPTLGGEAHLRRSLQQRSEYLPQVERGLALAATAFLPLCEVVTHKAHEEVAAESVHQVHQISQLHPSGPHCGMLLERPTTGDINDER
mmetsp:Transcript_77075/g.223686  ORF Transcript_77075/g.223686 Transcript_77075/m.223686 type:complete len:274 (+) Transcript_77075:932-1753(+)